MMWKYFSDNFAYLDELDIIKYLLMKSIGLQIFTELLQFLRIYGK